MIRFDGSSVIGTLNAGVATTPPSLGNRSISVATSRDKRNLSQIEISFVDLLGALCLAFDANLRFPTCSINAALVLFLTLLFIDDRVSIMLFHLLLCSRKRTERLVYRFNLRGIICTMLHRIAGDEERNCTADHSTECSATKGADQRRLIRGDEHVTILRPDNPDG